MNHLSEKYQLYYIAPKEHMFGGVGTYVRDEIINLHVVDKIYSPFKNRFIVFSRWYNKQIEFIELEGDDTMSYLTILLS